MGKRAGVDEGRGVWVWFGQCSAHMVNLDLWVVGEGFLLAQ
jgi:hypothetical protein